MRVNRLALFVSVSLTWFALTTSPTTVSAQSIEETYDATMVAYNSTLNHLEGCDQSFADWQQFAKDQRPAAGAPKADWDRWAENYRLWAETYVACLRRLKKEADDLKRKLLELQRQLDGTGASTETRTSPSKDSKEKAQNLLKKGRKDLEGWTLGVRYKIGQANKMSYEASGEVERHGSGSVKIEPRFEYDF